MALYIEGKVCRDRLVKKYPKAIAYLENLKGLTVEDIYPGINHIPNFKETAGPSLFDVSYSNAFLFVCVPKALPYSEGLMISSYDPKPLTLANIKLLEKALKNREAIPLIIASLPASLPRRHKNVDILMKVILTRILSEGV